MRKYLTVLIISLSFIGNVMPNGKLEYPTKGTPQSGIISPLLANIVLNELDRCVESNWEENPIVYKYSQRTNAKGN